MHAIDIHPAAEAGAEEARRLEVEYFTDPLCAWSWAFEAQWRRLRYEFGDRIACRYRMAGMIPDWSRYSDPLNDVGSPAHMGPHWYDLRTRHGVPLDERIWAEDPPASSFPASLAVKAAGRQGEAWGERYLRRLREAVMLERRNVARRGVLVQIAEELAEADDGGWDVGRFARELDEPDTAERFREDVKEARYREIARFPALVLTPAEGRAILLVGWRPYPVLRRALAAARPGLEPARRPDGVTALLRTWARATAEEISAALDRPLASVRAELAAAVRDGRVTCQGSMDRALYSLARPSAARPRARYRA